MTTEEKAAILDWLLTPPEAGRPDRPARIERTKDRNKLQALYSFRVWGSADEFLNAVKAQMLKEKFA